MCNDRRTQTAPWFEQFGLDLHLSRLQDKCFSDDDTECPSEASVASAGGSPSNVALQVSKQRWADLSDSEAEFAKQSSNLKSIAKVRWADIDDSDAESRVLAKPRSMDRAHSISENEPNFIFGDESSSRQATFSESSFLPTSSASSSWLNRRDSGFTSNRSAPSWHGHHASNWCPVPGKAWNPNFTSVSAVRGKGKGDAKGPGKGKGRSNAKKFQCQFTIQIEEEPKFKVVRRLLGPAGANVKAIAAETDAKLRLRGRGSKFLEGPEYQESSDPLMLCLSVTGREEYENAKQSTLQLLEQIYEDYDAFLERRGEATVQLSVQFHDGAREGSR